MGTKFSDEQYRQESVSVLEHCRTRSGSLLSIDIVGACANQIVRFPKVCHWVAVCRWIPNKALRVRVLVGALRCVSLRTGSPVKFSKAEIAGEASVACNAGVLFERER